MCGVAGIHAYHYAAARVDETELLAIRDHMLARGPDGKGIWLSASGMTGLAHRRLSIIELSDLGAQPMASANGRLVITFNGEIYNYRALRSQLESRGCVFRTDSDTEVILQMYACHGVAMLSQLRGMFAFAIWDEDKQATLLARDPYGIKPLYLADDGWTCRFASQVKALLASPRVSRAPEPAGVAGFYLFGSVPEPWTLYQEIRAVPAGSYQWIDRQGPSLPVCYQDTGAVWANAAHASRPSDKVLEQQTRTAVLDSVRQHLVADVPVGAFLSGGIDSGALVGLMRDAGQVELKTVTLGFSEYRGSPDDETPLALETASRYHTDHAVRMVDETEFMADFPRIMAAMDQPSIDGINTWFVSKAASEAGLKVAISGIGGDELFGGYPSFRDIPGWVKKLWLPAAIPGLARLSEILLSGFSPLAMHPNPKFRGMLRYGGSWEGAWLLRRGLFLPDELPALIGPEIAAAGLQRLAPLLHVRRQLGAFGNRAWPHALVATLESSLYLRNQLLRDADWAGMAHSLEIRTPLVDITLLKTLAPLLYDSMANRKHLLATAPSGGLPDAVRDKAKTGFTTPVHRWQQQLDPCITNAKPATPWARPWSARIMAGFGAGE
jgi:asparagine synthase (glutamine-hydrolysing)